MSESDYAFLAVINPLYERVDFDDVEGFHEQFAELTPFERHLFCAFSVDSEVCNGGFSGCLMNSTGICAPIAAEAFRVFGRADLADIIAEAIKELGDPFPQDEDDRFEVLESLPGGEEHFDALDARYWAARAEPDVYKLFDEQVRTHSS